MKLFARLLQQLKLRHLLFLLLLVAGIYVLLTGVIVTLFGWLERRIPKPSVA